MVNAKPTAQRKPQAAGTNPPGYRKLPVKQGYLWCSQSIAFLAKDVIGWFKFSLLFALTITPLSSLPGLNFVFPLFLPFVLGILYQACLGSPDFFSNAQHLMAQHKKKFMILGALNIGCSAAVWTLSFLVLLVYFLVMSLVVHDLSSRLLPVGLFGLFIFLLTAMTGYFVLLSMILFAPALVVFRAMDPWDSMMTSLKAVLKNVWPLTLYSLVILIPLCLAMIPLAFYVQRLELPAFTHPAEIMPWLRSLYRDWTLWLGLLLAFGLSAPVIGTSLYLAYKDIFEEQ